jgi:hypothetical protein
MCRFIPLLFAGVSLSLFAQDRSALQQAFFREMTAPSATMAQQNAEYASQFKETQFILAANKLDGFLHRSGAKQERLRAILGNGDYTRVAAALSRICALVCRKDFSPNHYPVFRLREKDYLELADATATAVSLLQPLPHSAYGVASVGKLRAYVREFESLQSIAGLMPER